ncbi:hypothetical protein [Streptomyces sp. BE133]|uniref:hypothetical protein n=1 Tax=Streptomyces sp. BE133 TaxID=3002523 RepID=UPI002E764643|nr:hypothetical protein [Streptomyces sp. BE133]MEE1812620.1 hypothetical protein [Streptomyces sp. BE133]
MANIVWHTGFNFMLDLNKPDLGHPDIPNLWDLLYAHDRELAARRIPVPERGLQCGGICRKANVVAWMYLRQQANGRREAVHERAEDEERHTAPMSDEHKAYQERIIRAAEEGGFRAGSEVRTAIAPRKWFQTDAVVENGDGLRIGWEIQLSSASVVGPRSVRSRASKALRYGITPAWHTDKADLARRNETQWTRSNNLPAEVIRKTGVLRVVSGFRALDIWRCDNRALYPCPDGKLTRCWKTHATPKPRDIDFDNLVRETAAGLVVPVEFPDGSSVHRFWVSAADRARYYDILGGAPLKAQGSEWGPKGHSSSDGPTCRPQVTLIPSQRPTVDWRSASHWSATQRPCRFCGGATNLRDDRQLPAHKVCHEAQQSA